MKVIQSCSFEKRVKRFRKHHKKISDKQIQGTLDNPAVDQEKEGGLRGVLIHKFKIQTIEYLLYDRFVGDAPELFMIGSHENYYRDLKAYLKGI